MLTTTCNPCLDALRILTLAVPREAGCRSQDRIEQPPARSSQLFAMSQRLAIRTSKPLEAQRRPGDVGHSEGKLPYDCDAALQNFFRAWSPEKKRWCCTNQGGLDGQTSRLQVCLCRRYLGVKGGGKHAVAEKAPLHGASGTHPVQSKYPKPHEVRVPSDLHLQYR